MHSSSYHFIDSVSLSYYGLKKRFRCCIKSTARSPTNCKDRLLVAYSTYVRYLCENTSLHACYVSCPVGLAAKRFRPYWFSFKIYYTDPSENYLKTKAIKEKCHLNPTNKIKKLTMHDDRENEGNRANNRRKTVVLYYYLVLLTVVFMLSFYYCSRL